MLSDVGRFGVGFGFGVRYGGFGFGFGVRYGEFGLGFGFGFGFGVRYGEVGLWLWVWVRGAVGWVGVGLGAPEWQIKRVQEPM